MQECYRSDYYLVKQACSIVLCKNVFAVHLHIFFCIFLHWLMDVTDTVQISLDPEA